jgi:acetyl coenzyme A synthetase (ADP forming)-like protein
LTLLVFRVVEGAERVIATGSYMAKDEHTAEVAFAVADAFQGRGLGTLLLERLALLAARQGFTRFWAVTQVHNAAMADVFRQSGFGFQEKADRGFLEFELSLEPTESSVSRGEARDRLATVASLRPFFHPRSVAVIGASRDPASLGHRVLQAILRAPYHGKVFPVNPKADRILDLPCFPSAKDIPEPVDLAVVIVPREHVLRVVDDCAARGIRALVVITAGFAEIGAAGRELQGQLLAKVRGYGMRMLGPNCMGLLTTDPAVQLNATFAPELPPPGRVAFLSQSGALGLAALIAGKHLHLGLSSFVSVGNKADISGNDLLQYWEEDSGTAAILLYLESFGNPRRFARLARRVGRSKPIVVVKAGRTKGGSRAAGSHTAALAASETAVNALFQQSGIIRAESMEEMFDLAIFLDGQALPMGKRVGILTNAGGPAILCADMCEATGLELPAFSDKLRGRLATFLPPAASLGNPVDMIASATPDQFREAVQTILESDEVDGLIVVHAVVGFLGGEEVSAAICGGVARAREQFPNKPVLACLMTGETALPELTIGSERIPVYTFPESAAKALSKAAVYADWRKQPLGGLLDFDDMDLDAARDTCAQALTVRGGGWLSAKETRVVLQAARLPVLPGDVAATADEGVQIAERIGFPVAAKLASTKIVHKTEIGGVHLKLQNPADVRRAFNETRARLQQMGQLDAMEGVLIQPMVAGGVELMAGVTLDPLFGPLIAFGLGGIYVEVLGDVCFRMAPLTDRDAAEMVRAIKGHRLLQGYRGHPPADIEAIQELLLRLSRLAEEVPAISEIDLNPIFALPPGQGCRIVDARIRVRASS